MLLFQKCNVPDSTIRPNFWQFSFAFLHNKSWVQVWEPQSLITATFAFLIHYKIWYWFMKTLTVLDFHILPVPGMNQSSRPKNYCFLVVNISDWKLELPKKKWNTAKSKNHCSKMQPAVFSIFISVMLSLLAKADSAIKFHSQNVFKHPTTANLEE